ECSKVLCARLKSSPNRGGWRCLEQMLSPLRSQKNFLELVWAALQDITLIILVMAAIISLGLSFYHPPSQEACDTALMNEGEAEAEWIEGAAILLSVMVVALVTAFNEWSKEKQFLIWGIMVGDITQVKYGKKFDFTQLGNDLKVDESSITGELDHVKKKLDKDLMLGRPWFRGLGSASVTGRSAFIRGNAEKQKQQNKQDGPAVEMQPLETESEPEKKKPVQRKEKSILQGKLTRLAVHIGQAGLIMSALTVFILIIRFLIDTFWIQVVVWSYACVPIYVQFLVNFFIIGVTMLVVAVPEGLPLAVTISLAYSVKKMMKDNNLVHHLDTCEMMGSATTICSDKTGTLTMNRMTVVQAFIANRHYKAVPEPDHIPANILDLLVRGIGVNCAYTSKIMVSCKNSHSFKDLGEHLCKCILGIIYTLLQHFKHIRSSENNGRFIS
uniref:P-type Ca(2+) transporter n=1 Tax=Maylandia zebra TaxID=106582 RepID=A0A3P9BG15_9CICH